jgi:ADP-dependent phosphofructokinase/glucokinase
MDTIDLIAKIAKATSNKILEDFEKSNIEVENVPKDIEELSATK